MYCNGCLALFSKRVFTMSLFLSSGLQWYVHISTQDMLPSLCLIRFWVLVLSNFKAPIQNLPLLTQENRGFYFPRLNETECSACLSLLCSGPELWGDQPVNNRVLCFPDNCPTCIHCLTSHSPELFTSLLPYNEGGDSDA